VIHGKLTEAEAGEVLSAVRNDIGLSVTAQIGTLQAEDEPEAGLEEPEDAGDPRPRVRRGRRWNAAYEIYLRCVVELGRKPYSPSMNDTLSNVARRFMKEMNVRHSDYPHLLPLITTIYFTPTEEDIMCAAVMGSSVHTHLRKLVETTK
jgi:hypothetical protein